MKKNKKLIFLMVVIVLASAVVCFKSVKGSSKKTLTVTDPDGITYLAVIDQNNNVYAGITDMNGNLYGARIDSNGYPVLDDSLYVVGSYDGTLPKNNTTAVSVNQTNSGSTYNYNAAVSVIDSTGKTTAEGETQANEQKEYLTDKYRKLFASGTYSMKFTSDDPDIPGEVLTAFKNGSVYMETTIEGIPAKVIYNDTTKTGVIVLSSLRTYCTLPDDMVSDMASGALDVDGADDYKKVKVYKVSINGRECTCESFSYENGEVKNYYYYDGDLVRMDLIDADGSSTVYNITAISSDVPDSYFEMPKGYIKLNLAKVLESQKED